MAAVLPMLLVAIVLLPLALQNPTTTSAPTASALPKDFYGLWTLAPALVAILLAVITRQVIVALACGIFTAAAMMGALAGDYNPLHYVTFAMNHYLLRVIAPMNKAGNAVKLDHITILIYTFFIGAMIGVLTASGGTRAVVERITRRVHSRRSGQLSASVAGVAVFFDDYASAMIVGPGLRPIFDRLRLSREKLAYIVNWTAAPVASLFLSTWLAAQIGYIDSGFKALSDSAPAFLDGVNAATTFWATIPYRVYPVLAIVMVFLVSLTGRDFGPLRRAEAKAMEQPPPPEGAAGALPPSQHWFLGALPAMVLVAMTLGLMYTTGLAKAQAQGVTLEFGPFAAIWTSIKTILGEADSNYALLYASLSAAVLAILLAVIPRRLTLAKAMEAAVAGMAHMFAACIILVLAWGLARASEDLQLGVVARDFLQKKIEAGTFSLNLLPLSVFVTACIISFATGTSWGTMALLCGPVVGICAGLLAPLPEIQALPLFYATVGAVMGGAVFGNTCSPLADVTVLSSIFSECELSAHVRTIFPYALVVAGVSVLSTDGLRYGLQRWSPELHAQWTIAWSLALGALLLLLVLLAVGRRVVERTVSDGPRSILPTAH